MPPHLSTRCSPEQPISIREWCRGPRRAPVPRPWHLQLPQGCRDTHLWAAVPQGLPRRAARRRLSKHGLSKLAKATQLMTGLLLRPDFLVPVQGRSAGHLPLLCLFLSAIIVYIVLQLLLTKGVTFHKVSYSHGTRTILSYRHNYALQKKICKMHANAQTRTLCLVTAIFKFSS